jgi:hypothetical protein
MALEMLAGQQPSRAEPTVILITSGDPECGALLDRVDAPTCVDEFLVEAANAVAGLEAIRANIHVLSMGAQDDTRAMQALVQGTTGRGQIASGDDEPIAPDEVAQVLENIGRDFKIQMVE